MSEVYWAPSGKKIGSTVKSGAKTNVYGSRGEKLGSTSQQGTFDVAGRRVANLPSPGLLMARSVRKPRR
jgi:hypothetical protein